jgi:nitrate/TMAO reductase-like tetraheme cytochrome c subunit
VLAAVGILAALMVVFYVPVQLTSTSGYCTSCHEMKAAGRSWSHSVHAKISCVECHVDPGLWNGVVWRVEEAKNIWASYLNAGKGMTASAHEPGDAACQQCHDIAKLPAVINGIKIPHQAHVGLHNLTCADCHSQASHATPGRSNSTVSMSVCSMCHNGQAAPSACATCHVQAPPSNIHPAGYIVTHGQQAIARGEAECLRCHHDKAGFCDACHARQPASHFAGDWQYGHGPAATKDRLSCLGCHDAQTFCQQCHQVDHPGDWVQTHGPVALKGSESCSVCHPRAMCVACHTRMGVTL